jgi:hypothetical protein
MFTHAGSAIDERRHAPAEDHLWNESWYFDFAARDGSLGGYVRLGLYPNLRTAWYWACVVGPERPLVIVVDHDVALPTIPGSLEVRTDGLWADHNCEAALERWSLALEAFAVSLDDPLDAYGSAWGERVAFGLDLEWETDGAIFRYPPGLDRYEVPCRVHGEVVVGADRIEVDHPGQRDHSWGVRDWWAQGWCWTAFHLDDGSAWHAVVPTDTPFSIGYAQVPGREPEGVTSASVATVPGEGGIPLGAALVVGSAHFTVEPLAWAPVLLTAPDRRTSRFARGMARFRRADGLGGTGWIEFNQPDG